MECFAGCKDRTTIHSAHRALVATTGYSTKKPFLIRWIIYIEPTSPAHRRLTEDVTGILLRPVPDVLFVAVEKKEMASQA
eukprot:5833033-Amphidinium_carterae.2